MKIDLESLEKLRRICKQALGRNVSDAELQDIGQRIIRYLRNSRLSPGLTENESVR